MINYIIKSTKKRKLFFAALFVLITSFEGIILSYVISKGSTFTEGVDTNEILKYFVISMCGWLVVYFASYLFQIIVNSIIEDLNCRIKSEYLKSALIDTNISDSEVLSFITTDMKMLETTYFNSLFKVLQMIITAIVSTIAMLIINLPVSILFLALSFLPNAVSKLFKGVIKNKSEQWSNSNIIFTRTISDVISGRNTLKVYSAIPSFYTKVKKTLITTEKNNKEMNNWNQLANLCIYIASGVSFVLPFVIGIFLSTHYGLYSVSTLVSIFLLNDRVVGPLRSINQFTTLFQKTTHIREKILQTHIEKKDFMLEKSYELTTGLIAENISLRYDEKVILNRINFNWKPGEKILIIGESGSGKTSLMNILTGKVSPTEGTLFLTDSDNVKTQINQYGYFNLIEQNPHVFEGDLRMNISLNKFNEAVIEEVQEIAFLAELELNHHCEKDGINLSGGQIQRIEIARALHQNNPIFFIDEMTASLNRQMGESIRSYILSLPNMVVEIAHHYDDKDLPKYSKVYQMNHGTLNLVRSN